MAEKYVKLSDVKKKLNYICRIYSFSQQMKQRISNALARIPYTVKEELGATLEVESAADVAPIKHGHWIEEGDIQICSECGEEHSWQDYRASYCDTCGAKMDGEDGDSNE